MGHLPASIHGEAAHDDMRTIKPCVIQEVHFAKHWTPRSIEQFVNFFGDDIIEKHTHANGTVLKIRFDDDEKANLFTKLLVDKKIGI